MSTVTGTVVCVDGGSNLVKSATSACVNPSSIVYKQNVTSVEDALGVIGALRPVSFDWKASSGYSAANGSSRDFGFIAQEVDAVLPELVAHDPSGAATGLSYVGMIPFAIAGIQQQQQQIQHLGDTIHSLQATVQSAADARPSPVAQADLLATTLHVAEAARVGTLVVMGSAHVESLDVLGDAIVRQDLNVGGSIATQRIVVNGHIVTAGDAPTAELLATAGQDAVVTVDGNDTTGTITIVPGSSSRTAGDLVRVTFSKQFAKAPRVIVSAASRDTAALQMYTANQKNDGFVIAAGTVPSGSEPYVINYFVVQ